MMKRKIMALVLTFAMTFGAVGVAGANSGADSEVNNKSGSKGEIEAIQAIAGRFGLEWQQKVKLVDEDILREEYNVFLHEAFNQNKPFLDIMDMPVDGIDGFTFTDIACISNGNQGKGMMTQIYLNNQNGKKYALVFPVRNVSHICWCFPWEGEITTKATFSNYWQEKKTGTPSAELNVILVPLDENFTVFESSEIFYQTLNKNILYIFPRNSCYFV